MSSMERVRRELLRETKIDSRKRNPRNRLPSISIPSINAVNVDYANTSVNLGRENSLVNLGSMNRSAFIMEISSNRISLSKQSYQRMSCCKLLKTSSFIKNTNMLSQTEKEEEKVQLAYKRLEDLTKRLTIRLDPLFQERSSIRSKTDMTFNSEMSSSSINSITKEGNIEINPFSEEQELSVVNEASSRIETEIFDKIEKPLTPINSREGMFEFNEPLITPKGEMDGMFSYDQRKEDSVKPS